MTNNYLIDTFGSIYSTLPEYARLSKRSEKIFYIKKARAKEWFDIHQGKKNAVRAHIIAKYIGLKKSSTSEELREVITHLICDDHYPIISTTKGFFKAETKEEINEYLDALNKRIMGIHRRISSLIAARNTQFLQTPIKYKGLSEWISNEGEYY